MRESLPFCLSTTMRKPVPGTVAMGRLDTDDHFYRGTVDGQPAATFPPEFEISAAHMRRGQQRFDIYCAPCHGYVGEGNGLVSERALARADSPEWAVPLSLHVPAVREQPVGTTFNTITNGIRKMPAYAAQIPPEDRWAIVLYVKALQRSQNASLDDVPPDVLDRLRAKLQ